ncbi:MAG: hypothetical protein LBI28_11890 [Treponema sp.]|jgi:hypothetical protein|nr:hypothetical protein [Treponema sp.]
MMAISAKIIFLWGLFMNKIAGKIAMFLVLVMLAGSLTGCITAMLISEGVIEIPHPIEDAIEEAKWRSAAATVIKYDDVDTF